MFFYDHLKLKMLLGIEAQDLDQCSLCRGEGVFNRQDKEKSKSKHIQCRMQQSKCV